MRVTVKNHTGLILLLGMLLAGCATSPSVLAPHGTDAARTASLTWLMFVIAGIVLLVISALLWISYRGSREERKEKEIYANDRRNLRGVWIGGGIVPIVVLMIVMRLGNRHRECIRQNKYQFSRSDRHRGHRASVVVGSPLFEANLRYGKRNPYSGGEAGQAAHCCALCHFVL